MTRDHSEIYWPYLKLKCFKKPKTKRHCQEFQDFWWCFVSSSSVGLVINCTLKSIIWRSSGTGMVWKCGITCRRSTHFKANMESHFYNLFLISTSFHVISLLLFAQDNSYPVYTYLRSIRPCIRGERLDSKKPLRRENREGEEAEEETEEIRKTQARCRAQLEQAKFGDDFVRHEIPKRPLRNNG